MSKPYRLENGKSRITTDDLAGMLDVYGVRPCPSCCRARLLQNLGPVIGSLQPTKDAVLRVGALLIVKVDWTVSVFQLTAAQQARLDHHPQLASTPHESVAALHLVSEETAIEGAE